MSENQNATHNWIPESDLLNLTQLSRALFHDPRRASVAAQDTLAAVALMKLTPEQTLNRTVRALLNQARVQRTNEKREKQASQTSQDHDHDHFRLLPPEDRFLITVVQVNHQNYEAASKILGLTIEDVAQKMWWIRIQLAHAYGIPYPTGRPHRGASCPDYDTRSPWTQRFLDDEIRNNERLFLQNHLMACAHCRAALQSCRNLMFALDSRLPRIKGAGQLPLAIESLKNVVNKSLMLSRPGRFGFRASLESFFKLRDVQIVAGLCLAVIFWKLTH